MKKTLLLLGVIALIAMNGCKKDESSTNSSLDNKDLVGEIFKAGMSGYSHALQVKSSIPINESVDWTQQGPQGGNIHVTGSITGTMNIDDKTGSILGGLLSIGLSETINDYAFMSNDQKFTMSGAPYVSLTGTFTLQPGGATFGTASSIQIGGGVRVVGPSYDQTVNIKITMNLNSTGTGGNVTGTIGGQSINYTF